MPRKRHEWTQPIPTATNQNLAAYLAGLLEAGTLRPNLFASLLTPARGFLSLYVQDDNTLPKYLKQELTGHIYEREQPNPFARRIGTVYEWRLEAILSGRNLEHIARHVMTNYGYNTCKIFEEFIHTDNKDEKIKLAEEMKEVKKLGPTRLVPGAYFSLSYAAGLFDGAGYANIYPIRQGSKIVNVPRVGIFLPDIAGFEELFRSTFQGNSVFREEQRHPVDMDGTETMLDRKPAYHWSATFRAALSFVSQIEPFVVAKQSSIQKITDHYSKD